MDCPSEQHARHCPKCIYLHYTMGAQFVLDKAKKNSRRLFVIVKCAKAVCVCVCVCVCTIINRSPLYSHKHRNFRRHWVCTLSICSVFSRVYYELIPKQVCQIVKETPKVLLACCFYSTGCLRQFFFLSLRKSFCLPGKRKRSGASVTKRVALSQLKLECLTCSLAAFKRHFAFL